MPTSGARLAGSRQLADGVRFVSLNLDPEDARRLRGAVWLSLASCSCRASLPSGPCADCEAMAAIVVELDRLLDPARAAIRRRHLPQDPSQPVVDESGANQASSAAVQPARPHLHALPGGLAADPPTTIATGSEGRHAPVRS